MWHISIYIFRLFIQKGTVMPAKIIAVANQKGGVAKTTTTFNLAAVKAMQGKRVLMIDLDPQASLTIACGIEPGEDRLGGYSTIDLFDRKSDVLETAFKVNGMEKETFLFVVPSDPGLSVTETKIATAELKEYFIKDACEVFDSHFDYIFLDCPPNLGPFVVNALVAANEVIIPVKTDYLSFRGLELILESIAKVKASKRLNPDIVTKGVVATMYRKRTKDHQDILAMLDKTATLLGVVKESVEASKGDVDGIPVVVSNPKSDVARSYFEIAEKI